MMMVLEVADEATPSPKNRPRPEWVGKSQTLLYNIGVLSRSVSVSLSFCVAFHRPLPSGVSGERRGRRWPWSTSSPDG